MDTPMTPQQSPELTGESQPPALPGSALSATDTVGISTTRLHESRRALESWISTLPDDQQESIREAVEQTIANQLRGKSEVDPWQVYTLKDAFAKRAPLEYLVDGLLPLPSLSIVYGAPGCMKSFLLGDLAVCVASGHPWLPTPESNEASLLFLCGSGRSVQHAPVIWYDHDNGTAERTSDLRLWREPRT